MTQRFNASKVLYAASSNSGRFTDNISISETEKQGLKRLRDNVRTEIRAAFKEVREKGLPAELYNLLIQQGYSREDIEEATKLVPKFFTQGSFAYNTLNKPATTPPQQIDIDDGVYFPMRVVEKSPIIMKNVLFTLVDGILKNTALKNKWEFKEKSTCARLEISPSVHMDIPIYAIPEDKSQHLEEAMLSAERPVFDSVGVYKDFWDRFALDSGEVYLALRDDEHWKISDPKKIRDWFMTQQRIFKQPLVRLCRYLKAWRDFTWKSGGPSSICLMVAVSETFNAHFNHTGSYTFNSDCEALLTVARTLPDQLAGQIENPVEQTEVMFPRGQSQGELEDIREKAQQLRIQVESALCHANSEEEVIYYLSLAFGDRIPQRPELVERIKIAQSVRQQPAQPQRTIPTPPQSQRSA